MTRRRSALAYLAAIGILTFSYGFTDPTAAEADRLGNSIENACQSCVGEDEAKFDRGNGTFSNFGCDGAPRNC